MVQSLNRGIQILEYLAKHRQAGCTEIAAWMGINKSSAFRLLQTLLEHDFVEQDEVSDKYQLGIGVLHISEALLSSTNIIELARPIMERLVEKAQESTHLCSLSNRKAAIIMDLRSNEKINVSAKVGTSEPWHCSSVGKCLLAFMPEKKRKDILNGLTYTVYTDSTILTEAALLQELEKTRAQGYAVDNEELNTGIRCVAAPIYNHRGEVLHCVAISATSSRMQMEAVERYAALVMDCAGEISLRCGYSGK